MVQILVSLAFRPRSKTNLVIHQSLGRVFQLAYFRIDIKFFITTTTTFCLLFYIIYKLKYILNKKVDCKHGS